MQTEIRLVADKVAKRFGMRPVLRGVSFEVPVGKVVAVTGHNGAGKSTLLRIVASLVATSAGQMRWHEGARARTPHEYRAQVGLFAPDAPVYRELSALENLQFFARARGAQTSDSELCDHLAQFALRERQNDLAGDLSSGLRARLGFAAATLHAPQILLLDEPSANLDEAGRALVRTVLEAQRRRGIALLATNDTRDLDLCDGYLEL